MIVCYLLAKCCLQNMRLFTDIFCQFVYKIRWRKQVVRNKNIHETLGKRHHIIWSLLSIYYFSMTVTQFGHGPAETHNSPVLLSCWYKFDRIWQYRYQQGYWYIFIPVTLLVQRSINMTEYSCRRNLSWYLVSISSCHLFFLLVGTIVWPIGSLYINLPTYRDRYINNTLILKIFLKNVLN